MPPAHARKQTRPGANRAVLPADSHADRRRGHLSLASLMTFLPYDLLREGLNGKYELAQENASASSAPDSIFKSVYYLIYSTYAI